MYGEIDPMGKNSISYLVLEDQTNDIVKTNPRMPKAIVFQRLGEPAIGKKWRKIRSGVGIAFDPRNVICSSRFRTCGARRRR